MHTHICYTYVVIMVILLLLLLLLIVLIIPLLPQIRLTLKQIVTIESIAYMIKLNIYLYTYITRRVLIICKIWN